MFDIDEIRKQALASMRETMEKNEERISKIEVPSSEKGASVSAAEVEEQIAANTQRQVEILGQMFGPDSMAQMAVNEELLQKMVNDKVAEATSATAGDLMGQLFGEDMGILAAALETLEMEDADDEEELSFDLELEEKLYTTLEETMARLEAMPEPEAIPYQKDDVKWERFGILLSGILSTLNSHDLDSMDVEEHIPVMEQKIVSLVRRSWGIDGRSDLLDMIRYLAQEGYNVIKAYDGEQAIRALKENDIQLLIIDIMMPKLDGIHATLKIREYSSIPIIILSAKSEDADKILGLNIGADDYVTKPFNPLELVARVKSQLRRYTKLGNLNTDNNAVFRAGGLVINDETKEVTVDGEPVKLTPIEYNILLLLVRNQGRVFSINQIYESIWEEEAIGADNTVAVHIRHIREKIEINPKEPRYLKVVWGVGYKIEKQP